MSARTCPNCQTPLDDGAKFCGSCGLATPDEAAPAASPAAAPADTVIGRVISGRYRIDSKLGEGGMGAVYKAEQLALKRQVVVKLLRPELSSSHMLVQRFEAEAKLVAKLSHPNTVNVIDSGQDSDGTLFIVMEFIEGRSLRQVIHAEAPLPLRRALHIAMQVATSISDAHAHSIIHRDLKPDNVMLQDRGRQKDVVRVLDFGIAKLRDEGRGTQMAMTQAGDMLGTPQYMAPEQIKAEQIDGRTDVYALGCMLYEMITSKLPYEAPTVMALLSKHLTEHAPPPSQRRPDLGIPPMIDDLIMSAMAKDAAHRPPTMDMFGERIASMLEMLPPDPGSPSAQRSGAMHPMTHPTGPGWHGHHGSPTGPGAMNPMGMTAPTGGLPMGAMGAMGPHTPPPPPTGPAPFYPSPPPGSGMPSPTPPPMGGQGYAAGTAPPGPSPYATQPPTAGSSKAIWIVVILLALAGGGVGIFFAVKKDKKSSGAADDVVDPQKPKPDIEFDDEPARPDPDDPDGTDDEPPEPPDPMGTMGKDDFKVPDIVVPKAPAAGTKDVWDDPGDSTTTDTVHEIANGVKINVPPGFVVTRPNGVFRAEGMGLVVIGAPIGGTSTDEAGLVRTYAAAEKLGVKGITKLPFAGGNRTVGMLAGTLGGVDVVEVVAILMGPSYRILVVLAMNANIGDDAAEQAFQELSRRLILPGTP